MDNLLGNIIKEALNKGPLPGEILREARRARDLSLQYIARQLRLSVSTLDALEGDDYKNLPSAIFVQGYIRSYAGLLGLDTEPLLAQYNFLVGKSAAVPRMESEAKTKPSASSVLFPVVNLNYVILAVIGVLVLVWVYMGMRKEPKPEVTSVKTPPPALQVGRGQNKESMNIEDFEVNSAPPRPTTDESPKTLTTAEFGRDEKLVGNLGAESGLGRPAVIKPALATLSIRLKKNAYVEVVDANNRSLLKNATEELRRKSSQGEYIQLTGKAPFVIRSDSAENVEILLNGTRYSPLRLSKQLKGDEVIFKSSKTTPIVASPLLKE